MSEQFDEIVAKLQGAKNEDEVIAICKEYGKDITPEQAQEALKMINVTEEELSLDDLEDIAGGGIVDTIKKWVGGLFGR